MSQQHPLRQARFLKSASELVHLPPDGGVEVAISGRSNAGKSSAINAICDQGKLARTSKTPGRTQHLVYFEIQPQKYLVDLPGYGYAKVPLDLRAHWQGVLEGFFGSRHALSGLIVVMDIRHPMKDYDKQMLAFGSARGLPAHVLLTKADKLSRGAQAQTLLAVRRELNDRTSAQLFSATSGLGLQEARGVLSGWLGVGA